MHAIENNTDSLLFALQYLVEVSASVDMSDDIFKLCVDFWGTLSGKLYM